MYSENQVKEMVQQILMEMLPPDKRGSEKNVPMAQPPHTAAFSAHAEPRQSTVNYEQGAIEDITAVPLQEQFFVPHPADREGYLAMKKFTPARLFP